MKRGVCSTMIKKCLGYRAGERLLIVCDDRTAALALGVYEEARSIGAKAVLVRMEPLRIHGEEPPRPVAEALKGADAALLMTTMSLSHTDARKKASRLGTRIASLPGITAEILDRSIEINYAQLRREASSLARKITGATRLEVRTALGTRVTMAVERRRGIPDDGSYCGNGAFGNLPAGEVYCAPREGTANGVLIVDGSAPLAGKLQCPVRIEIKDGYARKIPIAALARLIAPLGKKALNVAEFGIGLNPRARVTGNTLEDEKARGTAHIAFGNNSAFGGRVCR